MDESMAALDKRLRDDMQIEVRNLQRELKITTIAVTHDQTEALVMSDQVLVIDQGRLQQAGKPTDLYYRPASEFIAGFVGESNILRGRIDIDQEGPTLVLPSGLRLRLETCHVPANTQVSCMLRPEALRISTQSDAPSGSVPARVAQRIFSGDVIRIHLEMQDGTALISKAVSGRNSALPDVGDTTMVSWHPADLTIIPQ
jgi:ABC-type Fe3+/spermidine/putrescine transport system ATPase subunit